MIRVMIAATLFSTLLAANVSAQDSPETKSDRIKSIQKVYLASDEGEARTRSKMLHEMARGTLQVMHRDFFDEDNAHAIPSASLEDVFHEMERAFSVKMKWLTVNTDLVNVDHKAKTDFEKAAVKKLAAGEPFHDRVGVDRYQFAGAIRLGSQCLKCHVKRRTSNEERTAALLITMPLNPTQAK